ncbi:hypothetical protein HDE_12895 [Halotydeus destructor]|nr:hypothetical protein HDE_12895 [Halotydeus destructor]
MAKLIHVYITLLSILTVLHGQGTQRTSTCPKTHDDLNEKYFMRCLDHVYIQRFSKDDKTLTLTKLCGYCANFNFDNCHEDHEGQCGRDCFGLQREYKGRKSKNLAGLCGVVKHTELVRSYWNGRYVAQA